jgi:Zn finger protein HypA/HybF involved in hydrogenase expression
MGRGCHKCGGSFKLTTYEFITKAQKIHKNLYNYDKVIYHDWKTKVIIQCLKHGEFMQTPNKHLSGDGCPKCGGSIKLTTAQFIEKALLVHGNKYDYSNVNYINNTTKVEILCNTHGIFLQRPSNHMRNNGDGCPKCKESHGERKIREILNKHDISFKSQYTFDDCKNINLLRFDFAIINGKHQLLALIEYQGEQHYKGLSFGSMGKGDRFEDISLRDNIKVDYCHVKNIPLLLIPYWEKKNLEQILIQFLKDLNDNITNS